MRSLALLLAAITVATAAAPDAHRDARERFRVACARCHGEDGSWTAYEGIKPLRGIGKRLAREEIARRLHPMPLGKDQVTVRNHVLTREQLQKLVEYLATL